MIRTYKNGKGQLFHCDWLQLMSVAHACRDIVLSAQADGICFNRAQMLLDLVADTLDDIPLETLRCALVCAGVGY